MKNITNISCKKCKYFKLLAKGNYCKFYGLYIKSMLACDVYKLRKSKSSDNSQDQLKFDVLMVV